MAPGSIVKDFDVVEDIIPDQIPGFVDAFADVFLFQTTEERFSDSIDAPMSSGRHSYPQIIQYNSVKLPDKVSLQAAMDFLIDMPSAVRRLT